MLLIWFDFDLIWTVSSFCRQTRQIRVWEVVSYKCMEEWSTQCFMQVKSSSPGNRYYSVGEREALAIIWAVKNFHSYLYGQHFTLESDLRPLEYLQTSRSQNPRIMRWSLALQPYRYTVKYIRWSENVVADYLSRSNWDDHSTCSALWCVKSMYIVIVIILYYCCIWHCEWYEYDVTL